jgi:hypothetical protein
VGELDVVKALVREGENTIELIKMQILLYSRSNSVELHDSLTLLGFQSTQLYCQETGFSTSSNLVELRITALGASYQNDRHL